MKSLNPIAFIFPLLFLASTIATASPGFALPDNPQGTGIGTVAETIKSGGYIYLRMQEDGKWIATQPFAVSVGDKVKYSGGMEMRNFNSRTLNRTFDSIFFSGSVSLENPSIDDIHRAAMKNSSVKKIDIQKPASIKAPAAGEIQPLDGGKTIAEIIATSAQLKDQPVGLRARVIKVSLKVMGKNWVTLQDGTGTEPNNKLLVTSKELVNPGDLVIAKGIIRNDINLGAGYKYKVLLEEATFSQNGK